MDPWAQLLLVNRVLDAAPLLPFATAWLRRRHIPYEFKPVYYYVAAEAFLYFLGRLSRITVHNDIYIYHLTTVGLVFFLAATYNRLLAPGLIRRALPLGLALFALIVLLDAAYLNGLFTHLNSYSHAFGCVLLITLAMHHVAYLTASFFATPLEKQPTFILSVAVLLYCSSSSITYVAINIVYSYGYDTLTNQRLDRLASFPDTLMFAVAMALLAWMFAFFPLSTPPRRALPDWLHYSRWRQRPLRLLHQPLTK
jgi:hypothetical protein